MVGQQFSPPQMKVKGMLGMGRQNPIHCENEGKA